MTAIGIKDHQYKKLKTLNNFKSIIHLFMILYIGNILCRIMNSEDTVLVEFFAPWCPACVTFLPELEKLQEENWDIPMYKVGTLIMRGAGGTDLGAGEHGREPRAEGDVLGDDLPPGAALHPRQPLRAPQVREELGPQLRAGQQLAQTTTRLNYLLRHFIYLFYLLFTLIRINIICLNHKCMREVGK